MSALTTGPVTGPSVFPIGRSVSAGDHRRPSKFESAVVRHRTGRAPPSVGVMR